jgi:hypothetical protein
MPIVDPFGAHVVARLLDFFGVPTPWFRRLWCPGAILSLKEVIEASHAAREGILSEETFGSVVRSATALTGADPGVGSKEAKRALQQALSSKKIVPDGLDYETVRLAAEAAETSYFQNWSTSLTQAGHPGPERTARSIASHLLDSGFSPNHLHRWCTFQARNSQGANSLPELVIRAHTLATTPPKEFNVITPFEGIPQSKSGPPRNWMSANEVVVWLKSKGINPSGLIQNGALLFRLIARDPWAAIQSAVDTVDQLSSRVSLGTDGTLKPIGIAWVEWVEGTQSITKPFRFQRDSRRVEVHKLRREDKLYVVEPTSIVDAALEMVGALNSGPRSTAIGAGWAAIEALLSGPGDPDVLAGLRLAGIVACSFARAELTELSFKVQQSGHALAATLEQCESNRDRALIIANATSTGVALNLSNPSDVAAVERMRTLLANPHAAIRDIHSHVSAALVRMYKNRNLVLHWGKTDAVGLQSSLRCVAPLVGAGMDRIAHAWFVRKIRPMELAARARYALETVGSPGGPHVVDLLSQGTRTPATPPLTPNH